MYYENIVKSFKHKLKSPQCKLITIGKLEVYKAFTTEHKFHKSNTIPTYFLMDHNVEGQIT